MDSKIKEGPNMSKLRELTAGLVVMTAIIAVAAKKEIAYVGGEYGAMTNAECWSEFYNPGDNANSCVLVFDPGEGKTVKLDTNSVYEKAPNLYLGGIKVLSGSVTFLPGRSIANRNTYAMTNEIYVAEGSTLCFSNNLCCWTATSGKDAAVLKTGKGRIILRSRCGYSAASGEWPCKPYVAAEGETYLWTDVNLGNSYGFYGDLVVKGGANVRVSTYSIFGDYTHDLTVEEGGVLKFDSSGSVADHLYGAGQIVGGSSTTLSLRMPKSDCGFAGTIEGETLTLPDNGHAFTVGASNTLAGASVYVGGTNALKFAAGIGEFWMKGLSPKSDKTGLFRASDEAGRPVRVHVTQLEAAGTFPSVNAYGAEMTLSADELIVSNGDMRVSAPKFSKRVTVCGGYVHGNPSTDMNQYAPFVRPRNFGMYVNYTSANSYLDVDGGRVRLGNATNGKIPMGSFSVRNGGLVELLYAPLGTGHEAEPAIHVDGGTLRLLYDRHPYSYDVPDISEREWKLKVGSQGAVVDGWYDSMYGDNPNKTWKATVVPEEGVETEGGFTWAVSGNATFNRPVRIGGPFALMDGRLSVDSEIFDGVGDEAVFGTGDFVLGTAHLRLLAGKSGHVLRLATGDGSRFVCAGAGLVTLRDGQAASVPQDLRLGTLSRLPGGVLQLADFAGGAVDGTHGKVFADGVEMDAKGRVKAPVLAYAKLSGTYRYDFTAYDETNGFTAFAGYSEGLDGGSDAVAQVTGAATPVTVAEGETKTVAALKLTAYMDKKTGGADTIFLETNATLRVGNGTDPACLLLNDLDENSGWCAISGAGTLDFGTSEGVVAANAYIGYGTKARLNARIAGSGGVTYVGPFGETYPTLYVGGDNDYTGGTRIHGAQVRVANTKAFGRDKVTVGPGTTCGGQVLFLRSGTYANDFEISGLGVRWVGGETPGGALWFAAPVTLSGAVTLAGRARVGSYRSTTTGLGGGTCVGTFQGVVSGGALQLMQSAAPVVFEGANTYTGGTEVVSSTLILRGPCSVGTGEVALDNGVLRFENDAPITFTNDLDGVGTIELAGTAPVTFACKGLEKLPDALRTLNPGSTIDFPACTNCTVALGADGLDLGGAAVKVGSLRGSGRVENGVLMVAGEIQPGGEGAVGTLTFAPGVLVADGATFVCEVGDAAVDKIVVENAFDLSGLSLRTVQLGGFRGIGSILSATELSGEFAATEFAKKSHEVTYGDTVVTLSVGKGLLLIVR